MPGYFRLNKLDNIRIALTKSDIIVGIDYYALMGVCQGMIPYQILVKHQKELIQGKVFMYKLKLVGNEVYWYEIH